MKGCGFERGVVRVHFHGDMKERVCSRKRNGQGSFVWRYKERVCSRRRSGQGSFAWKCEGKGVLSKEEWPGFICTEI